MKKLKIIANDESESYEGYGYWPNPSSVKQFKGKIDSVKISIAFLTNSPHMNGHNFQILSGMLASLDTMMTEAFDHLNKTVNFSDEMDMDEIEDMNDLQKSFKEIMEGGCQSWDEFRIERIKKRESDGKDKEETEKE